MRLGARASERAGSPGRATAGWGWETEMTRWGYLTCGFMVACGGGSSGKNGDGGQCPDELSACQDECFDLATDPANCGICGHQCRPGQDCIDGACLGGDADSDVDSDADSDADPCQP